MNEVITWKNWTASYTPAEKKLVPKNVREAEFIHELKARFGGVLMEGEKGPGGTLVPSQARPGWTPAPSVSTLFPIPERARVLLELMAGDEGE